MKFLTSDEASAWCKRSGILLDQSGHPAQARRTAPDSVRYAFPSFNTRLAWFASWLVLAVPGIEERLVWVTETGVWPSSENWKLIESVRRGLGELRPLADAPAALAAADEIDELAAWLMIVMASGWDAHLLGSQNLLKVFVSHDEWVGFSGDQGVLDQVSAELRGVDVPLLDSPAI